ncbi:MAG TPA: helix-turn-helix transcriptional regulator [Oscillospiraceae bacterium]|nr:helix-turn-helix transcriptional regulator [Oscillospiraceae bacterium]HPF56018.1 helix-turn-helix transcriptional regulator [Clostridiales bacterium]HPK35493.1 helix-turn-helix transcriptional regulator [Oscillospiraceae bacterium]HPR76031.1 helix-turn-helix transcriptional regulator [Oscillospiraceae bacterium]
METKNHFTMKAIAKERIPFLIGWIIMFIWLYSYFLPFGGFRFESDLYNNKVGSNLIFTTVWLLSGALFALFINGKNYSRLTLYSVSIAILGFVSLRFTAAGIISDMIMIVSTVAIGYLFTSYCYAFFMILNNAEKFYSMLLAVFIPKLFMVMKPLLNDPDIETDGSNIIILILLLILFGCAFFNRNSTVPIPPKEDRKPPSKAYTLMLLVFAVVALNDVIAPAIIKSIHEKQNIPFEPFYFTGVILGIIIIVIFQIIRKTELYHILNLSFAFAALGFVSSALSISNTFYAFVSFLFFGLSYTLGFVNIYYLAGFMAKKFRSIVFYRTGIVLSSAFYLTAIFTTNLIEKLSHDYFNDVIAFSAFTSVIILITFLFSTPFFIKHLSSREWMDDTYRIDITHETRLGAKLKDYNLSPREIEACEKLLDGFTLRQISAIMGISFSTVNTYCNSIYKKLNINSRTELLVMFQEYSQK